MPANLEIGAFVLGAFLLVLAIVGGKFKLFGAEFSETIDSIPLRIFSGVLGLAFIALAFLGPIWSKGPGTNSRPTEVPTTIPTRQPTLSPTSPSTEGTQAPTGCMLDIQHPFITLKSEPDISSEDIITVKEGPHTVLDYEKTQFAGQQQTWFQIEDQGRKGWVLYLPPAMQKSIECP